MLEFFNELGYLGAIALLFGLIYIYLASKGSRFCWFFGIISCAIIAYEDIFRYNLLADAVLQIFYIFSGIWGWIIWKQVEPRMELSKEWEWYKHGLVILVSFGLAFAIGYSLSRYTDAAVPILDTWTSLISILATILLVKKYRSNWLYWMVANTLYIYIYYSQEAYYYVVLIMVYLFMSIWGYYQWGKYSKTESQLQY